jgi:hypothetical protein
LIPSVPEWANVVVFAGLYDQDYGKASVWFAFPHVFVITIRVGHLGSCFGRSGWMNETFRFVLLDNYAVIPERNGRLYEL